MADAINRVYRVTVSDRRPDGTRKAFTMIAQEDLHAARAWVRVRFGADRVVSVEKA